MTADGRTAGETAERLGISVRSVSTARRRLRESGRLPRPVPLAPVANESPAPPGQLDPVELERALVGSLLVAAKRGAWRSAAWLLERRYPERWAASTRTPPVLPPAPQGPDPFAEVDELARRRRRR
jgi:hypothetical protein